MTADKSKKKFPFRPTGVSGWLAGLFLLLLETVFVALLIAANLLPMRYLAGIIACIIAIDLGIFALLSHRGNAKLTGLILSVLMLCVFSLGGFYLMLTNNAFASITGGWQETEKFHVVSLKDSRYDDVDGVKDEKTYMVETQSAMSKEAQQMLLAKTTVTFEPSKDMIDCGHKLIDTKNTSHDRLIFVSNSQYDMIGEEIKGFKDKTKILYSVNVPVKSSGKEAEVDVTKDSYNIYITGIDNYGDIEQVGRSDVNMIVSVNPKTRQILLTSIPRDSYVVLHSYGQYDKLTHTGIYGVNETLDTVEDWMGIDLNFFCRANFSMVIRMINAVDGIDVYSVAEFDSDLKPYHYKKGWNHLNGSQALFFARERHAFDIDKQDQTRVKNQQRVMKALIKKFTSSKVILTHYGDVLEAIEGTLQTSFRGSDISALVKMQLSDMREWEIKTQSIDGQGSEQGTYSMGMGRPLYVFIPDEKSVEKAARNIRQTLYPDVQ